MSDCKTTTQVVQEIEYSLRLSAFLHGPLKGSLLYVLHNKGGDDGYIGLPSEPSELYKHFATAENQKKIKNLVHRKILKKDQVDILMPQNGINEIDSEKLDITLIVLLISNFTTLPPPKDGWRNIPNASDDH